MYGNWLKKLDEDSKHSYFGRYVNDESIDSLLTSIKENATEHHLLVAEDDDKWGGVIQLHH